jgi:hypothetical protein
MENEIERIFQDIRYFSVFYLYTTILCEKSWDGLVYPRFVILDQRFELGLDELENRIAWESVYKDMVRGDRFRKLLNPEAY